MKIENYNNIGISLVAFLSVVRHFDTIEYSKALLIQPLLLHNSLVNHLKNKNAKINGIEDLTIAKVEFFLNFNDRYFSLLPLSINTLIIANKMKFISLKDSNIIVNKTNISKFDFESKSLGNRAINIIKASEKITHIFRTKTEELYFNLRIEL